MAQTISVSVIPRAFLHLSIGQAFSTVEISPVFKPELRLFTASPAGDAVAAIANLSLTSTSRLILNVPVERDIQLVHLLAKVYLTSS